MKRVIYLIGVFSLLHNLQVRCQTNLVANPSFEILTSCPPPGRLEVCVPWINPTTSISTAYLSGVFNKCSSSGCCGVPSNIYGTGYQFARTGNGYASGFFLQALGGNIRNYSQVPLIDSLKSGHCYYVEFYVNLVNRSAYACNNLGLYISKTAPTFNPGQIIAVNPQIINYGNKIIRDTLNWIKVSGVYVAQGGEQYITIGNFKTDAQTDTLITHNPLSANCAQYNIDDVSVIPLDSMPLKADAGRDTTIHIGDSAFIGSYTNGIDTVKWQVINTNGTIDSIRPGFWVHPLVNTCYVLTQTVNGYTSSDTVCVSVQTVPLKMINYKLLMINDRQVENRWTTANEINVSHFYVQRSTNGRAFVIIHKEQANNQALNNYSFIDETPNEGVNYYKIVSVDKDGKTSFSEVRQIIISKEQLAISIYPNPAKDFISVVGKSIKEIQIINQLGQVVYKEIATGTNLRNDATIINIKNLNKGLYVVQITTAKGEVKNAKLIVE